MTCSPVEFHLISTKVHFKAVVMRTLLLVPLFFLLTGCAWSDVIRPRGVSLSSKFIVVLPLFAPPGDNVFRLEYRKKALNSFLQTKKLYLLLQRKCSTTRAKTSPASMAVRLFRLTESMMIIVIVLMEAMNQERLLVQTECSTVQTLAFLKRNCIHPK